MTYSPTVAAGPFAVVEWFKQKFITPMQFRPPTLVRPVLLEDELTKALYQAHVSALAVQAAQELHTRDLANVAAQANLLLGRPVGADAAQLTEVFRTAPGKVLLKASLPDGFPAADVDTLNHCLENLQIQAKGLQACGAVDEAAAVPTTSTGMFVASVSQTDRCSSEREHIRHGLIGDGRFHTSCREAPWHMSCTVRGCTKAACSPHPISGEWYIGSLPPLPPCSDGQGRRGSLPASSKSGTPAGLYWPRHCACCVQRITSGSSGTTLTRWRKPCESPWTMWDGRTSCRRSLGHRPARRSWRPSW